MRATSGSSCRCGRDGSIRMTTLVLYHAHCPDGFGAAWAAWRALGDDGVVYPPVRHGEGPPIAAWWARELYVLDFSYPRATMDALAARPRGAGVEPVTRVVDHHQ